MMVVVPAGELGDLEDLEVVEVKEEVKSRGGHQCSLDPNFFPTARKRRPEEERWHSSSRR